MTRYTDDQLYGKLPLLAVKDILAQIPKDYNVYQLWVHVFEALKQYYQKSYKIEIDEKVIENILQSYENQGHSGYSHGVATQAILSYLAGNFDDEDREFVKHG